MTDFIQLHFLTSYPPSNLNRDDLGRPKTAVYGGTPRLRISSQSLKRAWRTSDVFHGAVAGSMGIRTRQMGVNAFTKLTEGGVSEADAKKWATSIANVFAKAKKDSQESEQIAHVSPEEIELTDQLVAKLIASKTAPTEEDLELLRKRPRAADIAMFGRMLADKTAFNVEAAVQVAHAITTHTVQVEDDYFTAVDDLNKKDEHSGAGHAGVAEFASGVFYGYICINRDLLLENLQGDQELCTAAIRGLVEAVLTVSPSGKQNSYASRSYASFVLAERGSKQPRTLAAAFMPATRGEDLVGRSSEALTDLVQRMDKSYGSCADERVHMNVSAGEGSLAEILDFAAR